MARRKTARGRYLWLLLLVAPVVWLVHYAYQPLTVVHPPVEFTVKPGSSARTVARELQEAGLIPNRWGFLVLAVLLNRADKLQAGRYSLDKPYTPLALLDKITRGEVAMSKLTVVEGWTFRQMREAVDRHPRLLHETRGMSDAELLAAIGASEPHPEGLFFPATYYFDLDSSDLRLYQRAYAAMQEKLAQVWATRAPGLPYRSPYEALVMASIIERETAVAEERPLIAAVFVNRLRLGMRLQTDPAVIYGLGARFDGNLRKDDLRTDTPYNTYTRGGLPPTPIALPSEAALQAAVHPASSRALYFVATGDGRHVFSATLAEHNRAVARYQKKGS